MSTFQHSGKLGDIVYSLPAVRALGGGAIYVVTGRYGMNQAKAESILELLKAQPYITEAKVWEGEESEWDLDVFRSQGPKTRNLVECHLAALGLEPRSETAAWLCVEPRSHQYPVVFSRSLNRKGVSGFWESVYPLVRGQAVFVGTAQEHVAFVAEVGEIEHLPTDDLLVLAETISGAQLFIGSQSCPYALAEGLKKLSILEADPEAPNALFWRPGVLPVVDTDDLQLIGRHIGALLQGELPSYEPKQPVSQTREREQPGPTSGRIQYIEGIGPNRRFVDVPVWRRYFEQLGPEDWSTWVELVPKESKRVLHVGCSRGELGAMLKTRNPEVKVWGIERNLEKIEEASANLHHVMVGDAEKMDPLPFPEKHFHAVVLGKTLGRMSNPESFLKRLYKHVTKDATIVCGEPNPSHWSSLAALLMGRSSTTDCLGHPWDRPRPFPITTLRELLFDGGFVTAEQHAILAEDADASAAVAAFAHNVGIYPEQAVQNVSVLEWRLSCKPAPNPFEDEEKMSILLGPHVGKLGPDTKRWSVVVLTYNSARTIERCLDSILPSLGSQDELILVDNASQDETADILSRYASTNPRVRTIFNKENLGYSAGCNIGLLTSKGKYLLLLNPDTSSPPDLLTSFEQALHQKGVGAVGPVSGRVSGLQFLSHHRVRQPAIIETKLLIGFCLATRRDVLQVVGLLDESLMLGSDDVELSWRLRTMGFKLAVQTGVNVQHETGASFASSRQSSAEAIIRKSDEALRDKLEKYYGTSMPASQDLVGCNILPECRDSFC